FKALLYIPSQAPIDLFWRDSRRGVRLYVKNVFIADDCEELIPEYLRFVKGVVDSSDLPLNISREMLQDDAIIRRIRKNVVGKVLNTLAEIKEKGRDKYNEFYKQFGKVLKEGLYFEFENQDKLKELALYTSTRAEPDKPTSLKEYVERMPEEQKEIYYITAESREAALSSPHLEIFNSKGYEVLLFIDSIDELSTQRFTEYDGKKLRSINKGDIDLGTEEEKKEKEAKLKESEKQYERLLKFMQKKLESDVKEVRFSNRLTDSVCCLVADEEGLDITMEKLMKAMNQDVPPSKRILELNPDHPLLPKLKELYDKDESDPRLSDYIELLHDQALLTAGAAPRNPLKFTKMVSDLMVSAD
ncbi:MAG: molecular chaperone HtpG, partial [candidate division Zixibacteria bacterium]|nr:molecular chaperone HtpG [candidate division Zixibacteria bacterium]